MQYLNFVALIPMLGILDTTMAALPNPAAEANTNIELELAELNNDLNVTDTDTTTNTLARREYIHACQQEPAGLDAKCREKPYLESFVDRLAKIVKDKSDDNDCSVIKKNLQGFKIEYCATGRTAIQQQAKRRYTMPFTNSTMTESCIAD
ncbi:hypothetical protein BDV06DRAFT_52891 [Aspergillus oleicola]